MKNTTWDETRPHSKKEIKAEIDRLLGEVHDMMERSRQSHERINRMREETNRDLLWLEENLRYVGKSS